MTAQTAPRRRAAAAAAPAGPEPHPDSWLGLVSRWATWQTSSQIPYNSIRLRRYYVLRMAADHDGRSPGDLSTRDLVEWLAEPNWSANTRKSARTSVRAFYTWLVTIGELDASPADQMPAVKTPRGRAKPTPERAYREALQVADPRLRLALMLAGQCGLRRAEAAQVCREDVEEELLGWVLRVRGKGGHVRLVPLPDQLARLIRSRPAGWLFPGNDNGHISPGHLGRIVSRALPEGLAMHSLRHRCGTVSYAGTRDLRAVQELLGHATVTTTQIYTAVPDGAVRAAVMAAAV